LTSLERRPMLVPPLDQLQTPAPDGRLQLAQRQQVDQEEHTPEDNVDTRYYSDEMDFDNNRRDERMAPDALLEWECYNQQTESSSASSSNDSRRALTFERWYHCRQEDMCNVQEHSGY